MFTPEDVFARMCLPLGTWTGDDLVMAGDGIESEMENVPWVLQPRRKNVFKMDVASSQDHWEHGQEGIRNGFSQVL